MLFRSVTKSIAPKGRPYKSARYRISTTSSAEVG